MTADDDAALEAQQEVLANRFDGLEPQPVHAVGDARDGRPRVRRRPRRAARPAAGDGGRAVQRIALGHAASVAPRRRMRHASQEPVSGGGLNIVAVARRTGVGEHTLEVGAALQRAPPPTTDGGQRRYSEEDVDRVEWLAARLAEGYRIGEAADAHGRRGPAPGTPEELREALLAAASRDGRDGLEALLDHALALYPLEESLREIICPCLVKLGRRGQRPADGRPRAPRERRDPGPARTNLAEQRGAVRGVAVLACAPDELHELGLLMLACLLRADGWDVVYLGQSTPVADAVQIARNRDARVVAFSVTMPQT